MTWGGKFHRLNWMNDYGRNNLLAQLEDDMTDRMCRTGLCGMNKFIDELTSMNLK